MILVAFGFTVAQAQHANDNGLGDTLYLEVYPGDDGLSEYPADVKFPMFITNDIPDPIIDSIAGIVIPLCYTSTNAGANATIDIAKNNTNVYPFPDLDNSIFQHLPTNDTLTATDRNFLMDISYGFLTWDTRILVLNGGVNFWMTLIPSGSTNPRFPGGSRVLTATVTFTIDDSTYLCMDTCFWPPTNRLAFSRSDAVTYFPQIWDDYYGTEEVCVELFTIPNIPPVFTDPENGVNDQEHALNGNYTTDDFTVYDEDGSIVSITASAAPPGIANIVVSYSKEETVTGSVSYDVVDHCAAGGTVTLTATDDLGGFGTDDFLITLTNAAPVVTCPANATVKYCDGFTGQATATDANGDAVTFSGDAAADGSMDFTYTCQDVGVITYTVIATDVCGATDQCQFTVTVTNAAPTISCPENAVATAGSPHVSTDFVAADDCNDFTVGVSIAPASVNAPVIVGSHVEWQTDAAEEGLFVLTLTATDGCGLTATCDYEVDVVSYGFTNIFIPNSDCVNPGEYVCLPILIDNNTTPFGGFEVTGARRGHRGL
jgi:hypothetical protein